MYIATFYSFKGGVGRTMALVNVAVSLALRGRRVLVVDFDVEAPGLDTFDVLRPQEDVPGVIDFVAQYLETRSAPDASGFIGRCDPIGEKGGGLWIMPSGKAETYSANFKQLDWGELYERHDGYLLFEDLKEQWSQIARPDYVLIDSRTGHTDTSGICTRHLPDSVVILFFPNEQNLRGLAEVVKDIRAEAEEPRSKSIALHYVMSNVPDLDDEDSILEGKISAFQDQLRFRREPLVIHRYDSLSLLNQVVFSKDRPKSRLAKEYQKIVREVSMRNPNDRDGAMEYIRRSSRGWRSMRDDSAQAREEMLESIEEAQSEDGEVLFRLSELRQADGQPELAAALIDQAIDAGYERPDAYLKRSRFRIAQNEDDGARQDLWHVLNGGQLSPPIIRAAIGGLAHLGKCFPNEIVESAAVISLDLEDSFWLASTFDRSKEDISIAVALWENILQTGELPPSMDNRAKHHLGLSYMGCGRFAEAAEMFLEENQAIDDLEIADAFNYGMAKWGEDGKADAVIFRRVLELDRSENRKNKNPNYLQCIAIASWAAGENSAAIDYLDKVRGALRVLRGRSTFSGWRYRRVSAKQFEEDLDEVRDLIIGVERVPRFIAMASSNN